MALPFSANLQKILQAATEKAQQQHASVLSDWHFLEGFSTFFPSQFAQLLDQFSIPTNHLTTAPIPPKLTHPQTPTLDPILQQALQTAPRFAEKMGDSYLGIDTLFASLLHTPHSAIASFAPSSEEKTLQQLKKQRGANATITSPTSEDNFHLLQQLGRDLTDEAARGAIDPVIGRDSEIRRVIQILSRRTKNNPLLLGEPGVGKTAIAEGLAVRIVKGDVPSLLKGKKIISIDVGSLLAGTGVRGTFEERIQALLKEIEAHKEQLILFIDEAHLLVGAGKTEGGSMDAANLLKPALARGTLRCMAATTRDEYQKYIEQDSALERRFQTVPVAQPTPEEAFMILKGLKDRYESYHGVQLEDAALQAAVTLSHRYIPARQLPDKAIDLIDEAAAFLRTQIGSNPLEIEQKEEEIAFLKVQEKARALTQEEQTRLAECEKKLTALQQQWDEEQAIIAKVRKEQTHREQLKRDEERYAQQAEYQKVAEIRYQKLPACEQLLEEHKAQLNNLPNRLVEESVTPALITKIVSRWTQIPVDKLATHSQKELLSLAQRLEQRVVGQTNAIETICEHLLQSHTGLKEPQRPMGVFLFCGPTGVGKTELARALTNELYHDERKLIRLDMSEFSERHEIAKLIGAPPGYVGYESAGQLTEKIRHQPYSLVLLDEIEKAHPDVFHLLLQVFDEGRLTDGKGRAIDCRHCLFIMTSNLGSEDKNYEKAVQATFKPEFINRIDAITPFEPLTRTHLQAIVHQQLEATNQRLQTSHQTTLHWDQRVEQWIAEQSFDPHYGARPLKRWLAQHVLALLARQLLTTPSPDISLHICQDRLHIQADSMHQAQQHDTPRQTLDS